MAGFSIADFFAKLSIKADTKEVKKIEDSLNRINKSLKMIGADSVAQAKRMDTAFSGDALIKKKLEIQAAHDRLERMGSTLVGFKERLNKINTQSEFLVIKNEIKAATLAAQRFKNELKLHHNTNSILGKPNIFKKPDSFSGTNDKGNDATNVFRGGDDFFERTVQGRRLLHALSEKQVIALKATAAEQVRMKSSIIDANLALKEQVSDFRKSNRSASKLKVKLTELSRAQNRLKESARQLALSMVGAFAIFEGVKSINRVGQDFEAMEASMLAVSGTSEAAAKDLAYLRSEAVRLGLNIKDTTKAFIKLKAGAGGKTTDSDLKTIFEGLTESSTVLGLSAEETTRAIRGVVQMFGKGGVRAEELRQQVGEVLPVAMRALEKSMGKSSAEITKMLELGQIGTDVLPAFGRELKNIAREGGGLTAALKTVRVQENRLISKLQTSQETIFNNGFDRGILSFYQTMIQVLKDLEPALKSIGSLFGEVFKIGAKYIQLIATPLEYLGKLFDALTPSFDATNNFANSTLPKLAAVGLLLLTPWGQWLAILIGVISALEEIYALTSKGVVGQIERDLGRDIGFDFSDKDKPNGASEASSKDSSSFFGNLTSALTQYNPVATGANYMLDWMSNMVKSSGTPISFKVEQQPVIDHSGGLHIETAIERAFINGQAQR